MRLHFIGVGGSGMSAVARLAAARGVVVTGSNLTDSAYFQALVEAGMDVRLGHDAAAVEGADAVVVSTAVRPSNVELARATELGIPVWHRSKALAWALEGKRLVAVAGSHGKTTTSALVAHVFHACGVDATFAVGGRVFGVTGAVAGGYGGTAEHAVVEADESDRSFLTYDVDVAIVLNVEADHFDNYASLDELDDAFVTFATGARVLIACADDPGAARVAARAERAGVRVVRYAAAGGAAADVVVDDTGVTWGGLAATLEVPVPGVHNRLNAAAAWAAVVEQGVDPAAAAAAVATFGGTGRRFEVRGESAGVRVVDDYAHHPTEVAAVLAAARSTGGGRTGAGRIVVLFQPALFTRTKELAAEFGAALSIPNAAVILAPVHGDREDPIAGVDSGLIAAAISPREGLSVQLAADLEDGARRAVAAAREGDLVMTIGSGTVTQAAAWILAGLGERRG